MNNASAGRKQARAAGRRRPRGVHGGIPTLFRAACHTASHGGASGYASAGWHLANSLGTQVPYDVELAEWAEEVDALCKFAADENRSAIRGWFELHFPAAMQLVPTRRRDQFVTGVIRAWDDGRVEV